MADIRIPEKHQQILFDFLLERLVSAEEQNHELVAQGTLMAEDLAHNDTAGNLVGRARQGGSWRGWYHLVGLESRIPTTPPMARCAASGKDPGVGHVHNGKRHQCMLPDGHGGKHDCGLCKAPFEEVKS